MNRYYAFIKVVETGSFSRVAEELGYTQSAVSQMVKTLENELSATLILRSRKGVSLTPDGEEFLPYIRRVHNAHLDLLEKQRELQGLQGGKIRVGTFASVSCNWLPILIGRFQERYPNVSFSLHQGEYSGILQLIREGSVDFGFINPEVAADLKTIPLATDEMLAVFPCGHPLAEGRDTVALEELVDEPFILLDEGQHSEPMELFKQNGLNPKIRFHVYDDYTIMSMVEQRMGISILPALILRRTGYRIVTRPIRPSIARTIGIAYRNRSTMPTVSRYFVDFIVRCFEENEI